MMENYRKPVVAGLFYPAEPNKLKEQIRECFVSSRGPGLPEKKGAGKVLGAIVPHAGYVYSGYAAAHAYKAIAESEKPESIIILAPSHTTMGSVVSVWVGEDWLTPLGRVPIDLELAKRIARKKFFDSESFPHKREHAIEVQLPFLQFIFKTEIPPIVPIVISIPLDAEICKQVGAELFRAIKEFDKKALLIISSDFTHYGLNYGYLPFSGTSAEIKHKLKELDEGAIKPILNLNCKGFISYTKTAEATICGAVPIAVGLFALKELGAKAGKLLNYYTSAEITKDFRASVSYASIIFK